MEPEPQFVLRGEKIGLGPLRGDLLDTYLRWVNDLRVTRTLSLPSIPHTREKQEAWLRGALVDTADVIFTIYDLATSRPIGNTGLHDIDHNNGTADFGILIGEAAYRGAGYGTEATRLTLDYAFDVLGLYNIWLQVSANNPGAIRAYEKAGFQHIGVRRRSVRVGRELINDVYMDAIADDFEPSALARIMHPPEESR